MVGENMARHKAWVDVVLKLKFRLSKWKAKTLSIGGRLTLLKSVLGASPLYNMSIFKAPKGVLKEMESIHFRKLTKKAAPVDASFRRPVRGGIELNQFNDLVSFIDSVSLSSSHDRWVCRALAMTETLESKIRNSPIEIMFLPSFGGRGLRLRDG
ncbi:hypothetical protein Tco_0320970 [Tanacetum coccineum]